MNLKRVSQWMTLLSITGVGPATCINILTQFESIASVFAASSKELKLAGFSDALIQALKLAKSPDLSELDEWLNRGANHFVLTIECHDYPRLLKQTNCPPTLLYGVGDRSLLNTPQIAVVGSRNPTAAGLSQARKFSKGLARQGLTITSGLALGIDGTAHSSALSVNGTTIAVAATGLDRVYPARHRSLAQQISETGLIISEFPLGTQPKANHFPQRNRIISGLSLGTLVVEAAPQSGSLITARLALEQGREVFAIPGSVDNTLAKGCHLLIKQGAHLVESIDDVLSQLGWLAQAQNLLQEDKLPRPDLTEDLYRLLVNVDFSPTAIDTLVERVKKPVAELSPKLLTLELEGWVTQSHGGYMRLK